MMRESNNGPMLNAYPDSIGTALSDSIAVLKKEEFKGVFDSFYILPSIFNTDLDRGFSVIDYGLNKLYAADKDLKELKKEKIHLKLDFVLNHASVLSEQFQDIIKHGEKSKYADFFINWNTFWEGMGTMTEEGYILPKEELLKNMFFRKPGLPILMVRMPDGREVPYWNTFYQEVKYKQLDVQDLMEHLKIQYTGAKQIEEIIRDGLEKGLKPSELNLLRFDSYKEAVIQLLESSRRYLGQMDLNIKSPLVWEYYDNTLKWLSEYGAEIVRLDAFAYAPKEPGEKNFLNEPGTWDLLNKVKELADRYHLILLPEIHASYSEKIHETIAEKGFMTYDFFLPGLILDALERKSGDVLIKWAKELYYKKIRVVNMLGCHDGIPLLDLKGMIEEEQIETLIQTVVERGGFIKNLHGQKNIYYQINATYYSALGEDDKKMLLARAIQLFMPGKPQVWYLDLFAGKNDYEAVKKSGGDAHKEINRTNLTLEQIEDKLKEDVVKQQIKMLQFRNSFKGFSFDGKLEVAQDINTMEFMWEYAGQKAVLTVDFSSYSFMMTGEDENGNIVFHMKI